jgi:hypothetical protein
MLWENMLWILLGTACFLYLFGGGGRGECGSTWVGNDIEGEEIRHENKCVWKMPEGTQLKERKIEV